MPFELLASMDRTIARKSRLKRWALMTAAAAAVVPLTWEIVSRPATTRLTVDPQRLTIALVARGELLEYYPCDGTVEPAASVYLDVEEGGRVESIAAEAGQHVEKGDLILRFSNASLQRTAIDTESQLLYNLDIQRNTQFSRAESTLLLKESLLDLDHQIGDLEDRFWRYDILMQSGASPIPAAQFDSMRNQLQYLKDKRGLMVERMRQEQTLSAQQMAQVKTSIERLNASMELLGHIVKSLEVRAPIAGYLSSIAAQVGESIDKGQRIGQIDRLEVLKVRARIDQYYISRVQLGTRGRVEVDGREHAVRVEKIYPEVKDNAFEADVVFTQGAPESLKRGQSLTVELTLGGASRSLMVAKGGFFQETAGRWAYLLAPDGSEARRVSVRFGRQNPLQTEVLEGLHEGDRIIISSYETFNAVDELRFTHPISNGRKGT